MRRLIAVLGMHRSGTSATAGVLQEYGVHLGPVSERNRFNPRGNREIRELNRLHDRILERNGGSWSSPPAAIAIERSERAERDAIVATIPGQTAAVKDPRMLLLLDFWLELEPLRIGVVRNPVAVRSSLARRAKDRPRRHPQLAPAAWEELWCHYNRLLLAEHDRDPFPIVDFDRHAELDEQVRAALAAHGVEPQGDSRFFEPGLLAEEDRDWRSQVHAREALELWDELAARSQAAHSDA